MTIDDASKILWTMVIVFAATILLMLGGCGTNVVFVPPQGVATRVGPGVTGRIYTWDGHQWVLSANKAAYQEGDYIVAPPTGATTLPAK